MIAGIPVSACGVNETQLSAGLMRLAATPSATPSISSGNAVAQAIATKTPLAQLDLTAIDPAYGPDAKNVFSLETALAARTNPGAPSISNVMSEIARWKADLT